MVGRTGGKGDGERKAAAPIIIHHSADYRDIRAAFSPLSPRYSMHRRRRECRGSDMGEKEVSRLTFARRIVPWMLRDLLFLSFLLLFLFSFFFAIFVPLLWVNDRVWLARWTKNGHQCSPKSRHYPIGDPIAVVAKWPGKIYDLLLTRIHD